MQPTGASSTTQACDACRRRKVRCDGNRPCAPCNSASLGCTSLRERRKGGRRGKSAHVLNELRAAQRQDESPGSTLIERDSSLCKGTATPASVSADSSAQEERRHYRRPHSLGDTEGQSFMRTSGLLPSRLIERCIDFFFTQLGGTVPILHRPTFEKHIEQAETCLHTYCLLAAFCAFVVAQTGGGVTCPPLPSTAAISTATANTSPRPPLVPEGSDDGQQLADLDYGRALLQEAINARKQLELFAQPARQNILVSFFLYGSYIGLGDQRHAYYYLREATTLYTSGIWDAEPAEDAEHPSVSGKLFWLLLVSERAHAIRRHRPVTLQVTPASPALPDSVLGSNPDGASSPMTAFRCLVNLYHPFDETFLGLWNGTHTACSADLLVSMENHVLAAVPADLDIPSVQLADLRASQQWLRTVIWQLSTTLGFLSSGSPQRSLTFQYPLQIARDLAFATWKLPLESISTHGVGLIEKLSEVTSSLIDVMAFLPAAETKSSGFEIGPQDYLRHFFSLISLLRGGRRRFLPLLLTKLSRTLPHMVEPIVTHLRLGPIGRSGSLTDTGGRSAGATYHALNPPLPSPAGASSSPTSMGHQRSPPLSVQMNNETMDDISNIDISKIGDKTPEIAKAFLSYSLS